MKPDPLHRIQQSLTRKKLPPVHLWNPQCCGDMDLVIKADGSWWHQGARIKRQSLVRLFSTVLRQDEDGETYLVTPVEKWRIQVERAHFRVIDLKRTGAGSADQQLLFVTDQNDVVVAGKSHRLWIENDPQSGHPLPLIHVRGRLIALISRPVYYQTIDLSVTKRIANKERRGVWSDGVFFPLD